MGDGKDAGALLGRFCWPEANVKDTAAAKAFYTGLFGWTVREEPSGGYAEWQVGGKSLGGLIGLGAEREKMGIPPHWIAYVAVASADETAAKVRKHGGKVLHGPFSLPGVGRFASIQDPTGAHFALYQAERPGEAPPSGIPGTMCWNELATPDTGRAGPFYEGVFGWTRQVMPMATPSGDYTVFLKDGAMAAGMMEMKGEWWGDAPPHWMTYFSVADCDGSAAKAASLGGKVIVPPTDIPNVGRFAVIGDPQGAVFSILRHAAPG